MQMIPAWIDGILQPFEKLEVHEKGLKHKAVSVFLMSNDQTLIQRRAKTKYHTPNLWANSVCTHPFIDEASDICAHRRLRDELGISGVKLDYCQTVEYRADVGNGLIEHEIVDIFVGQIAYNHPYRLNPEEVSEIRWIPINTLIADAKETPHKFTPWMRIYLRDHKSAIFE